MVSVVKFSFFLQFGLRYHLPKKKKKMKKLHIMYIDKIILQTLKGPPPLDLS